MATILKDIADFARSTEALRKEINSVKVSSKSLSRLASDAILQFPTICSKGISIEGMSLVTKAIERQYSSFLLIVTSLYNTIDADKHGNIAGYLRTIHQNKNDKLTTIAGDIVDMVGEATVEVTVDDIKTNSWSQFQESIMRTLSPLAEVVNRTVLIDNISSKHDSEAVFNEAFDTINEYKRYTLKTLPKKYLSVLDECFKRLGGEYDIIDFKEELLLVKKGTSDVYGLKLFSEGNHFMVVKTFGATNEKRSNRLTEAGVLATNKRLLTEYENPFNLDILNEKSFNIPTHRISHTLLSEADQEELTKVTITSGQRELKDKTTGMGTGVFEPYQTTVTEKITQDKRALERKPPDEYDPEYGYLKSMASTSAKLMDNDVKKSNELVPTMLTMQQIYIDPEGRKIPVSYNVGVKAIMHPVTSEDMVKNLSNGITRNRKFFDFFRWTTGEINFWKDFVLTLDDIRDDVLSKYSGSSNWWTALKRRRVTANFKRNVLWKANQILPNATIVCTMEEVDFMKKEYSIDFRSVKTVIKVMTEYFLLGFCIVDEASELAYFFFDGEKDYQTYSFNSLERENSNRAKETRDIMRILSKM